jgi:hypothetical protein
MTVANSDRTRATSAASGTTMMTPRPSDRFHRARETISATVSLAGAELHTTRAGDAFSGHR